VLSQDDFFCSHRQPKKARRFGICGKNRMRQNERDYALGLFLAIFDGHDEPFGCVGADLQPCPPSHRYDRNTTSEADGGGRPGMGSKRVRDGLVPLAAPHVLLAAAWRAHLGAPEKSRGPIDQSRRAIKGSRHDRVHPGLGLVGLEGRQEAQSELFFGGRLWVRGRFARSLSCGDPLLRKDLGRFIPCAALRGRRREDPAPGYGDFRGHQDEQNEALPPERAATFFVASFLQIGERLGRLRARVVGVVDDAAA
jgi:hypothetical protein